MDILELFFYLQTLNTALAVTFNLFLVYIVGFFTRNKIGAYKWIIISFALFEAVYAVIVLVGMPVHYVAEGSWLVFNHGGLLGRTTFSFLGPSLYCTFYEIWIGFMLLHFVYRYIVVCKQDLLCKIQEQRKWNVFVVVAHFGFLAFTCFCGMFLCTRQVISQSLEEKVKEQFNLDTEKPLGYILLTHKNNMGEVSLFGTSTIFNHYLLVLSSSIIIFYCSVKIWISIKKMQAHAGEVREVRIQRQMFYSLVIQTAVPVIFCHIPSVIYLSFPLLDGFHPGFSFGISSLLFTWVTSAVKWVDPLIVIIFIREYRRAAAAILRGKKSQIGVSTVNGSSYQAKPVTHLNTLHTADVVLEEKP